MLGSFTCLDLAAEKIPAVWISREKICATTEQYFAVFYDDCAGVFGRFLTSANVTFPEFTLARLIRASAKVAEPHATVLVLIPEDLYVQVGAR